jgi:hypothetical protein
MNATENIVRPPREFSLRMLAASILLAIVVGAASYAGVRAVVAGGGGSPSATTPLATPSSPAIEEKYGIRVLRISPTADAGLIEVVLQVIDTNKASNFLGHNHNAQQPLRMIDADTGTVLSARTLATGDQGIVDGQAAYVLFGNPQGIVRHGTRIDVYVGTLVLRGVPVQ